MSISASGGARARRLSTLLASTALVSVAALSMAVTGASAACTVSLGPPGFPSGVNCGNTTTTNTANLNGGTNPSSDRIQEFNNNNSVIFGSIGNATVDGYGLSLRLTSAVPGAINFAVSPGTTVTTDQGVNALELIGNGGLVYYAGSGTLSTTAGAGNALAITNTSAGSDGVNVFNTGVFSSISGNGLFIQTQGDGPILVYGDGTFSGFLSGMFIQADDNAGININTELATIISGTTATGINASSQGGHLSVTTRGAVSGGNTGIRATTLGTGTVTVTTSGAVTGTGQWGILTAAVNGNTSVNVGNNVTAGTEGIRSGGFGSGTVNINHTAGTIAAGTIGIVATQSGSGNIDINQTGGALNGTTQAVNASMTGSGDVIVSLFGGTVGTTSGNVVETSATTGTTTITSHADLTSTGDRGISATSTTGTINIGGNGAISGQENGVQALASGAGNINVTSGGAVVGVGGEGIFASSTGGDVLVATGGTVSGGTTGIRAKSLNSGTVTVNTGGAVTGTATYGIHTDAVNGATSVNIGHNVTAVTDGIRAVGNGSGTIDINHTAGTIAAGTIGINAAQSDSGTIGISQTGGALNGTTNAVSASMTGSGDVIVSLTGGTVGSVSGNVIETSAMTGTTTITTDVNLTSTGGTGIRATSTTGTININGSGAVQGADGIFAQAFGTGNVNITSSGAVTGGISNGIRAQSSVGNVLIATGSTVSGAFGIAASTSGTGTMTVTTGGAVTGTSGVGISTLAVNGTTTVNAGHDVTGGTQGIWSSGSGSGLIDINHTAGTITAGTTGIRASQTGSGTIDISQTGGALNGTTQAVIAQATGTGNLIVSLTGGTVGNVSGAAIVTLVFTGTTTITTGVAISGQVGISSLAASGDIAITNTSTITGGTYAVFGGTSGAFNITNNGTLNGNVNNIGANIATSTFANSGTWNTGTASSVFRGSMSNTGTLNMQNGTAGHTVALSGNYSGNGAYRVDVDAAGNADRMNIGGTANLAGGSVNALFLPGTYVSRNYTIMSATGGLGGTTFTGGLTTTNLPTGFVAGLSYTPTDVLLDLYAFLGTGANLNPNQQNVAGTINNFFNNGGALPPGFVTVFGLTGSSLGNALTQLSGEPATGAQQGAFQLGNGYLSLLTDPFATNRVGANGAIGFAQEPSAGVPSSAVPAPVRSAFAAYTKAPPLAAYAPGWDVWGAAFGGANTTRSETMVGSNQAYTRAGGVAAGADYRISPNALIGVSLAGGNINWSLTGNGVNGGGTSDAFLAGIYGKYSTGQAYVSGAFTYSNYWTSSSRTVTVAGLDQLKADYNARGFGGRIEGGYRLPVAYGNLAWTPYGAAQGQSFGTPGYGETAVTGSNQFALNFASRTATAWRGELGVRIDKTMPIDNGSQLNLFGRFAYAHDEISNPAAAANFTTLGLGAAPFTVYGARPSRDLALTSAGAEWRLANGVSFLAKFDGEFGDRSQTYTATGRLRYTW